MLDQSTVTLTFDELRNGNSSTMQTFDTFEVDINFSFKKKNNKKKQSTVNDARAYQNHNLLKPPFAFFLYRYSLKTNFVDVLLRVISRVKNVTYILIRYACSQLFFVTPMWFSIEKEIFLYPTQRVAEGISFLPVRQSVIPSAMFSCQRNFSETSQQNFVKLCRCKARTYNVDLHIHRKF